VTALEGAELVIEDEGNTRINLLNPNNKSGGVAFGDNDDSSIGWMVYDHSQNKLKVGTNNSDRLVIDSQGQVGIGTTSPSNGQLEVSSSGTAIYGTASAGTGIFGVHDSPVGGEMSSAGIVGSSTTGSGVVAYSDRDTWAALAGFHRGDGPSVYGSGGGAYPAVEGMRNDDGTAVGGFTDTGKGVYGYASSTSGYGVVGMQDNCQESDYSLGFWKPGGLFGGSNGLCGFTKVSGGYGVLGLSLDASGYAGYFQSVGHGVLIYSGSGKTGLAVYNGTKSAAVEAGGTTHLLYCEESSEVWFTDYGFGRLKGGSAVIDIDPVFAQTVALSEPYHVFLQPYGNADLYVAERTAGSFEVRLGDGDPEAEFSYRIVAKRKGFETQRLELAPQIAGPFQAQEEE
jgi:hypothetical protein